jgi:hypothetical protein
MFCESAFDFLGELFHVDVAEEMERARLWSKGRQKRYRLYLAQAPAARFPQPWAPGPGLTADRCTPMNAGTPRRV